MIVKKSASESLVGSLTPVSGVKHPSIFLPSPTCRHPDVTGVGRENPASWNPHVLLPVPSLISRNPRVPRMWRRTSNRCGTMRRGWGRCWNNNLSHHHLSGQEGGKESNPSEKRLHSYPAKKNNQQSVGRRADKTDTCSSSGDFCGENEVLRCDVECVIECCNRGDAVRIPIEEGRLPGCTLPIHYIFSSHWIPLVERSPQKYCSKLNLQEASGFSRIASEDCNLVQLLAIEAG